MYHKCVVFFDSIRIGWGLYAGMFGIAVMLHFEYPRGINFNLGPLFVKIEKI